MYQERNYFDNMLGFWVILVAVHIFSRTDITIHIVPPKFHQFFMVFLQKWQDYFLLIADKLT